MTKNLMNRMVMALLLLATTIGASAQIDLDLNLFVNSQTYDVFQFRTLEVEINNTGNIPATGVEVELEFPFNNYFTTFYTKIETSQGTFHNANGTWSVGEIAAGGTAFVNITFQPLSLDDDWGMFAQVIAANESDTDSTPDNNTTQMPNEDDEDYFNLNPLAGGGGGTGGGDTPIDNGVPSVEITTVNELVTGAFNIQVNFSEPVNDFEMGDLVVENAEILAIYGGNQYFTLTVQPFPGDVVLVVVPANAATDADGNGNTVSEPLFLEYDYVEIPIDLELALSVSNATIGQWENTTFSLTISNTGMNAATDVRVDFGYDAPNNPPLAFVSQNVSMNEYDSWNGLWKIPTLGAGESRVLELTLFALEEVSINLFAQVLDANEVDIDSSYGNDNDQTVDEDDEAIVGLTISNTGGLATRGTDFTLAPKPQTTIEVFPNPTTDYLQLSLNSAEEVAAEILVFDISGQLVAQSKCLINKGFNQRKLDFTSLGIGVYTITVFDENQAVIANEMLVKK